MNPMSRLLLALTTLGVVAPFSASAQDRSRHADTWTFGSRCRMQWNADASAFTLSVDPAITAGEGCASFSNPVSGDLLIYTNGNDVYRPDGTVIFTGLQGDSSSMHAGVIVPVPGKPGFVWVFGHKSSQSSTVQYAQFDVTGTAVHVADSAGAVQLPANEGREGMLVVPHANGVDYWLLVSGATKIFTLRISSAGLGDPVSVDSGLSVWTNGWSLFAMNHQFNRLVMSGNAAGNGGDIAVWRFDSRTGALTDRTVINDPRPEGIANRELYGGVFSPDGTKLYYSVLTANDNLGRFNQYDFETGTFTELGVGASRYFFGDARLGPDGRIYVAGSIGNAGLHVVNDPNAAGADCDFVKEAVLESAAGWNGNCGVTLGLPQSPSPLSRVELELAVTIDDPGAVVVGTEATVGGGANAPDGATVLATLTGPGGTFTCNATVADAVWACADPVTGLTPGAFAVDALLTFEGAYADASSTSCAISEGDDPAEVCVEVCEDTTDNDLNGYVDVYDPVCQPGELTCTVPASPADFTIRLKAQSALEFEDLFWPITGDVDADGEVEIVAANRNTKTIQVLNGTTLAVESSIPVDGMRADVFAVANLDADPELELVTLIHQDPVGTTNPLANRLIIANLVDGAWVVNIAAPGETAYNCGGNVGSGLGLGFADFDADGKPEIFYGNEIWTWTGNLDGSCTDCIVKRLDADRDVEGAMHGCHPSSSNSQGPVSAVADVLSVADCAGDPECEGPELIVASQVFSVDMASGAMTLRRDLNDTFGFFGDGMVSVADIDGDNDLDIVVHGSATRESASFDGSFGDLYAWDPNDLEQVRIWDLENDGLHGSSPVAIADVWDEDLADDGVANGSAVRIPELIVTRSFRLHATNVATPGALWSLTTTDHSGATSVAVFDFNGDGTLEMAYRDANHMRVMYGGPMDEAPAGVDENRDYAKIACTSATMNEGPAIADVDGDGSANLIVVCGVNTARVQVFESASVPWRESRRVWNQPIFVPGAIDELGRVYPVAQPRNSFIPEGFSRRPLNNALSQTSPLDLRPNSGQTIAAIDAVISDVGLFKQGSCDAVESMARLAFTVTNHGDAPITADVPFAIYLSSPEETSPNEIFALGETTLVSGSLPLGPGESARFELSDVTGPLGAIRIALNVMWEGELGLTTAFPECDITNNDGAADCQACTEEVCDGEDNDCDGVPDNGIEPIETTCGIGACAADGFIVCEGGEETVQCTPGQPAASDATCDGIDDDCNGVPDEDFVGVTPECPECQAGVRSTCAQGREGGGTCEAAFEGEACEGGICALAAACEAGRCVPTIIRSCDDSNPCTSDFCDADEGCMATALPDGTSCSDGNGCTLDDVCAEGVCGGVAATCGPPAECEGAGVCNPDTGVCDYPFIEGCIPCEGDRVAPELVCPDSMLAVECVGGGASVELGLASARDACSAVTLSNDAPETFPVGVTIVTYTATDAAGNQTSCTTSVEVVDTAAPVATCPERITLEGEAEACGAEVSFEIPAEDACDDTAITWLLPEDPFYGPGETDVRIVGVDAAGNQVICDTVVEVTGLEAFDIECVDALTVEGPADVCGWPETLTATVVDACQAEVEIESDTEGFPIGESIVTFTAERPADEATASCATTLTVLDVTAPTVSCGALEETVDLVATFVPTADDACTAEVTVSGLGCVRVEGDVETAVTERCDLTVEEGRLVVVSDAPPSEGGTMWVTWTVTGADPSGNTTSLECRSQVDPESLDHDGDGVIDREDNCMETPNADQLDNDLDGAGDACDPAPYDGMVAQGSGCGGGGASGLGLAALLALLGLGVMRRRMTMV